MKVLRIVILSLSVLVGVFFVVYANIQTRYAKDLRADVEVLKDQVIAHQQEAEEQRYAAIQAAAEARLAMHEAETLEKLLKECRE